MKIICDAVPFGFGPVSKLLSICQLLWKKQHDLTFIGNGCSVELASRTPFFRTIISAKTMEPISCETRLREICKDASAIISVMNPEFAKWAIDNGLTTIIVDSLFTMWDRIPEPWYSADATILQVFEGVEDRVNRELNQTNTYLVGPILDCCLQNAVRSKHRTGTILVNLGGAEDPVSDDPFTCANLILELFPGLSSFNHFQRKVLAVGPKQCSLLSRLKEFGFEVATYPKDKFLNIMRECDVLLSTPGLTTSFEAFTIGVPCAFLPPFNYSQFLNLLTFRDKGLAPFSIHWHDYGLGTIIRNSMPETQGVQLVDEIVNTVLKEADLQEAVRSSLEYMLARITKIDEDSEEFIQQREYIDTLGGIGTRSAFSVITQIMNEATV